MAKKELRKDYALVSDNRVNIFLKQAFGNLKQVFWEFKKTWNNCEKWLNKRTSLQHFFAYALLIIIPQGLLSLVHSRNISAGDPKWQWEQIYGIMPLNDVHSVGHTLYMWPFKWLGGEPIYSFAQLLVLAIVVASGLLFFTRRGIPIILSYMIVFAYAYSFSFVHKVAGTKDVPYSIAILILCMLCIKIFETKATIFKNGKYIISMGIVLALITLFRHNGIVVTFGMFFMLLILYPKYYLKILSVALVLSAVVGSVWGFAFGVLKAEPNDYNYIAVAMTKPIFAVIAQDGNISREQLDFIDSRALPLDIIRQYYSPYSFVDFIWNGSDKDLFDESFNYYSHTKTSRFASMHAAQIRQLFFDLLKQNPTIMLTDIVKSRHYIYSLWWSEKDKIEGNSVHQEPTHGQYLLALIVLMMYLVGKKRRFHSLIVFAPVFLSIASVIITLTPEPRYVWATNLCFPMILLFFITEVRKSSNSGKA